MDATLENLVREIIRQEVILNSRYWLLMGFVTFVISATTNYLTGYFKKRGEDKAALIALERITRMVEEIKSELQARHTLRFAALDKRVQKHQKAYSLVLRLFRSFNLRNDTGTVLRECDEWYHANILYLDATVRNAFSSAYIATRIHNRREGKEVDTLERQDALYQEVRTALNVILEASGLPPLKNEMLELAPSDEEKN